MYRKFENPITPRSFASVSGQTQTLLEPPRTGDVVTFKAHERVTFHVLVEIVGTSTVKGEVTTIGALDTGGGEKESYNDWNIQDKIEVDLDKLDGVFKK